VKAHAAVIISSSVAVLGSPYMLQSSPANYMSSRIPRLKQQVAALPKKVKFA